MPHAARRSLPTGPELRAERRHVRAIHIGHHFEQCRINGAGLEALQLEQGVLAVGV